MSKKFRSKNHISGQQVSGGHTSVIDGVSKILNRAAGKEWFISVRPGEISTGKKVGGGTPFVSVKKHKNPVQKNTLTLSFKRSGVIQKIYIQVKELDKNIELIIRDLSQIVNEEWKGAELINRI
jgi:hypothetical protein